MDDVERQGRPWLRDVVLYLTAQSTSLFGSAVVAYAIVWYITLKTGSAGQYVLLVIASSLAMALTTIPGGILADRYWRKALMIGADAGVAVATAILAVVLLGGNESLWIIAVVLAIRGLGGGIQMPAMTAALPQIAPAKALMRVNSVNQALQALIHVAAPALAIVLLSYIPLGWILMVDVTTAAFGIIITLFIRIPRLNLPPGSPKPEGLTGYVAHVGEAVRYAWRIAGLRRTFFLLVLLMTVIIPYAQMTPIFVVRLYGSAKWMLAATEITWSLGMVVGGVVIAAWGGLRNRMTMIMIACFVIAAGTAVMGLMPAIWGFLVIMAVLGLSLPMLEAPAMTAIQELIPETMMGRLMGFIALVNGVGGPIGMAMIGPLADHLDLRWMALACGLLGLLVLTALVIRGGPGARLMATSPVAVEPPA